MMPELGTTIRDAGSTRSTRALALERFLREAGADSEQYAALAE